jgi:hypothetical protein
LSFSLSCINLFEKNKYLKGGRKGGRNYLEFCRELKEIAVLPCGTNFQSSFLEQLKELGTKREVEKFEKILWVYENLRKNCGSASL